MNLVSVRCQHCGAPLQVGEAARFVTCQFCKTELSVERTDSAIYTQQLGEIHARTTQMAGELEVIRLQNDLDALDREWLMERERYMVSGQHGSKHEPGMVGALLSGGLMALVGLAMFVGMASAHAPGLLPMAGLAVMLLGIVIGITGMSKASAMSAARSRYERARGLLSQRMAEARAERQ